MSHVFRKVSLDRLASPEQLDMLMRVTNPRSWLALAAIVLMLIAGIAWSITTELPIAVSAPVLLHANADSAQATLYLTPDDSARVAEGMVVEIEQMGGTGDSVTGRIVHINPEPLTPENVAASLGNPSLTGLLVSQPLVFQVDIALDAQPATVADSLGTATITIGSYRPITLFIPVQ
jgi:hypothetical protein